MSTHRFEADFRDYRSYLDQVKTLYLSGLSHREIANDPRFASNLLKDRQTLDSKRRKIGNLIERLMARGELEREEEKEEKEMKQPAIDPHQIIGPGSFVKPTFQEIVQEAKECARKLVEETSFEDELAQKMAKMQHGDAEREDTISEVKTKNDASIQARRMAQYEHFIGVAHQEKTICFRDTGGWQEIIVLPDPHIPDEDIELISRICARHPGAHCVIAGDLNDFAGMSAFPKETVGIPTLEDLMAKTDAFFEILMRSFSSVEVMLGNHDLRIPRMMSRTLNSSDLHWMSLKWLRDTYEQRHGVRMVRNEITRPHARSLETYHWHQIGDVVISHLECSGKAPSKGVQQAHDFFYGWKESIGLSPFKIILQAHTHRVSHFKNPVTGIHCYEIGALCGIPAYAMQSGKWSKPQSGYFHLVQHEGVTDLNLSRLYMED